MADFCTIMTVVPTGGIDLSSEGPLGCGPTDWCGVDFVFGFDDAVEPPPWLAVDEVETEVAELVAGADPLLAEGTPEALPPAAESELDAPPHAASSSIRDPSPVAAAQRLLRITSPIHRDGSRSPGPAISGLRASRYKAPPGRQAARPGNAAALSGLSC
jgi:hypothetical protein